MKHLLSIIILASLVFSQTSETQSFKLKDGTVINGTVLEENDETFIIQTKYGSVTLNKSELVQTEYEIILKSGETFSGTKLSETDTSIQLKTKVGVLNINKSDIENMKESGQVTQTGEHKAGKIVQYRRPYSLSDMLFGTGTTLGKDIEFAMGEERLIDTFFDPTAYVLDDGTLYLSGLSFAFGLSDKLQVSSRWADYFRGNFNLRPKYMLYQKGNWEKESALAIGGHFHTYWKPDKVIWRDGTTEIKITTEDCSNNDCVTSTTKTNKYYGGYFPIGASISGGDVYVYEYNNDYENNELIIKETEDLDFMVELFTAYTFSKARKGMRGRVSNTLGALVQAPMEGDWPYRIFWGVDVDITPQLKMVGETFYDPFFLDLNHRSRNFCNNPIECIYGKNYKYKVSDLAVDKEGVEEVTKDDFKSVRPIHFDFGFMYAVNEQFRFGIHTQPYIIAFYWKF